MQTDFTNKVVLVTGASVGIGEFIALNFAKCGAKLILVGRNVTCLEDVAKRCENEKGLKPLQIIADLAEDDACESIAKKNFGPLWPVSDMSLDVLVNNAGIGVNCSIQNTDMKQYDLVFRVNVRAVYNLKRLLVPALIETKGNIVNISSIVATKPMPEYLPYAMTKAALDHFNRLTALELAPKGVRVNTVSPGVTISKFMERMTGMTEQETKPLIDKFEPIIPMRKACDGNDIAKMVLHIASDNSRLVNGTTVQVDGGFNLGNA